MKVVIIGNYHEGPNGWAIQLQNHILALDLSDVDVYPRRLNITGQVNPDIHPRVLELEKRSINQPDIIIQNTLPSLYEKVGRTRCVGYYMVETDNFHESGWTSKINIMDANIVPGYASKQASIKSGVTKPIHIVPLAIDLAAAQRQYETHIIRRNNPDSYIFYVIAEWTKRKNLEAMIAAFHLEFSPAEPVQLFIKTTPVGMTNPQQDIEQRLNAIKQSLKLYNGVERYKKEAILCGYVSESEIFSLHQSFDCYVNTSHAEAFCLPAATALAFGKTVITSQWGGLDYFTEKNSYILTGREDYCIGNNDQMRELYTGREQYFYPSLSSIRQSMRSAYNNRSLNVKKKQQGLVDIQKFGLDTVGKIYRETLEKILQ